MKAEIILVSNGDFREEVCRNNWPKQQETLAAVEAALGQLGCRWRRVPAYSTTAKHGMITTQAQAAQVLAEVSADAPIIVVFCSWVYAHHLAGPLATHQGPILLLANFDGTFPGLVSLLNHAATLDRMGIPNSRLWTDGFTRDAAFMERLERWCASGKIEYSNSHLQLVRKPAPAESLGNRLAAEIRRAKRLLGQFDPGCMGMLNAVIDPAKLALIGMPLELLNQSDLLAEMSVVSDREAQDHLNWLVEQGVTFHWGTDMYRHLVHAQVLVQMKMYSAAARFQLRYGLSALGIPYQYGLVRSCPASDLAEGMLNNSERPDVFDPASGEAIRKGKPIIHFNEGDVGAAVPQVIMHDILERNGMCPETTLHDVRWGSEVDGRFVWVLMISGGAPPAHFGGWANTHIYRQPRGYFPLGGGTCSGVSKPGTITWARFYEAFGQIGMDCGTGEIVELPECEVNRRLRSTNPEWPIANACLDGYGRDELLSTHMSNHIVICYGDIHKELIATSIALGIPTRAVGAASQG